ncbi:MAG: tetratricopeptide repeat protein [Rhizobiaceae bacterium]|nr:tetratricopeptide repeat protein [Rhizobiaceae bacterium]
MRVGRTLLLAAVSSLVLAMPLAAKETTETVDIRSFSGAYLAARIAEVDNDLDSAIAYYERALAFDPDNQTLQQSLMLSLITTGRFDESLPLAEKLKTVPEVERFSRLALAVDAFRKQDFKAAEYWLKLALASDLDRLITGLMTAWAKAGEGDADAAFAAIDALQGPEWYGMFMNYHRALIAEGAGRDEIARQSYDAVMQDLSAGSAAPESWLRAAEAYANYLARKGDKEGALKALDAADEFASGRVPLQSLRLAVAGGMPIEPLVSGPVKGASEVLLNLGTALNRGGGETYVRLYLQYARALNPDGDSVLLQLAGVAEVQEDPAEAIALYERIPASSPLKRLSELQLGLNLADLDRKDEAVQHLTALLEAAPDDMRAYLALGGVYASQENYREAAKVYDRAADLLPSPVRANWNIFYQRGIAYERLKEWPKAEPNFRKALELYPDQPQVLNYLGYSWVDMNMNLDEGLELIRRAVDLRPSDGYIVDSLGWAYYRLGRFDEAVVELERAVSLKPDDAVLNDHLGDAYWRVGRKLEATFQWSHARDLKPEPDVLAQVQKKLAEGLPAVDKKTAEEKAPPIPEPEPEKRSEAPADTDIVKAIPAAYKVQVGQSLWSIAVDQLGNGNRYLEILNLNPELRGDPSRLVPGQSLRLPASN